MSSLSIFKQKMRERLGTSEEKSDVKEASEMIGIAHEFRDRIKKTEKAYDKYSKTFKAAASTFNDLGEVSHEAYVDAKVELEQQFLANAFSKLSETEKILADSTKAWGDRLDYDVTRFLRILLDEEVKDLEKPESKFEQARLAYDAVVTETETARKKDSKQAKLQAAEDKEKEARRKFELVGQEMRDDMADLNALIECEVIERLCDYVDSTREHFAILSRYFNEMVPFVYQARRYVQEGRERKIGELAAFKEEMDRLASMPLEYSSSSSSQAPTKISRSFGVPLTEIAANLQAGVRIPVFLVDALAWLEKHAMHSEGLFRMNASASALAAMKSEIDKEGNANMPPSLDPNLIAGLVKLWFREMPEPILTHSLYPSFIETNNIKDETQKVTVLKNLINSLPAINRDVLHYLMYFLYRLSLDSSQSKMTAGNLATCFAPNLISPAVMDLATFDPFEPRTVIEFMITAWDKFLDQQLLDEIIASLQPASPRIASTPQTSPPVSPRNGNTTGTSIAKSSPAEPGKKLAPAPPARKPRSSSVAAVPAARLRTNTVAGDNRSSSGSSVDAPAVRSRPPPPQRPSRPNVYGTARTAGMKNFLGPTSETEIDSPTTVAQNKVDALDLAASKSSSSSTSTTPVISFSITGSSEVQSIPGSPIAVAKTIFYSSTPPPEATESSNPPPQPVLFSLSPTIEEEAEIVVEEEPPVK